MSNEILAEQHHWLDEDGNVTTDETKGSIWLVREGSPITKEMADKYGIGKVTPQDEGETATVKADKPKSNKSESPTSNKGAK